MSSIYEKLNDRDWLYTKYWVEKATQEEIAKTIGCCSLTVSKAMVRLGIPSRNPSSPTLEKTKKKLARAQLERWSDPKEHEKHSLRMKEVFSDPTYRELRSQIAKETGFQPGIANVAKRPEVKKKISKKLRGRPKSEEHKLKLREANKGHIVTKETKEKISGTQRKRHEDGFEIDKEKNTFCVECWIRKYGEEKGKKLYHEFQIKQASKPGSGYSKERLIEKYGKEEGKQRYELICRRIGYAGTKEGYIERYGEIEGTEKYNRSLTARIKYDSYSKISQVLFQRISAIIGVNCFFATNGGEYIVTTINGVRKLDFYVPERRKGIEFDGEYWHNDPKNDELRDKEILSTKVVEAILHIREQDFYDDPEDVIAQCVKFLSLEEGDP